MRHSRTRTRVLDTNVSNTRQMTLTPAVHDVLKNYRRGRYGTILLLGHKARGLQPVARGKVRLKPNTIVHNDAPPVDAARRWRTWRCGRQLSRKETRPSRAPMPRYAMWRSTRLCNEYVDLAFLAPF